MTANYVETDELRIKPRIRLLKDHAQNYFYSNINGIYSNFNDINKKSKDFFLPFEHKLKHV